MGRLVLAFATVTLAAAWPLALAAPAGADTPAGRSMSSASAPALQALAAIQACCTSVSEDGTGLGCTASPGDPSQCTGVPADCDTLELTVGSGCTPIGPSLATRDTHS